MTELKIANVVGMITYQQELDLVALAKTFEERNEIMDVTYEPTDNHWLQTRFAPDDTYVAFYRTGRYSIAGCRSIEHFETMTDRVNAVIPELLDFEYEPEQFSALVYRGPDYVILVFASGKLLCTGLTDLEAVSEAVDDLGGQIQAVV